MRFATRKRSTRPTTLKVSEHQIQTTYFKMVRSQWPKDKLIYAVPNHGVGYAFGLLRAAGSKAGFALMNYLRAEGFTDGVPDVNIDHARGVFKGLRIEFKVPGNTPSDDQQLFHAQLKAEGYLLLVHTDAVCAFGDTIDYMSGDHRRFQILGVL